MLPVLLRTNELVERINELRVLTVMRLPCVSASIRAISPRSREMAFARSTIKATVNTMLMIQMPGTLLQLQQFLAFARQQPLHRDARPRGHHLGDVFLGHLLAQQRGGVARRMTQAQAQYRATVITAFQNVADALRALQADARAVAAAE